MPTMDALEILAEEGRRRRRYSSGRGHHPLIRRFPNGEIRLDYIVTANRKVSSQELYSDWLGTA